MPAEESHFKVLRLLESNPRMTQREVASALQMSVGKANYCVRALVRKGLIKAVNFKNSRNKMAYTYLLTPRGIEQKAALTLSFLRTKTREYEELQAQLRDIRKEAAALRDPEKST
jgi:EPS-associated MarR family transcriptional regulator